VKKHQPTKALVRTNLLKHFELKKKSRHRRKRVLKKNHPPERKLRSLKTVINIMAPMEKSNTIGLNRKNN